MKYEIVYYIDSSRIFKLRKDLYESTSFGAVSQTTFSECFKFDGNCALLSSKHLNAKNWNTAKCISIGFALYEKNHWRHGPQFTNHVCRQPHKFNWRSMALKPDSIVYLGSQTALKAFNPLRAKHKTYIHISCHSSTLIWHRWLKSFLK